MSKTIDTKTFFKERFNELAAQPGANGLQAIRQEAFQDFDKWGIPTTRHEEWKYTRISSFFNQEYDLPLTEPLTTISAADLDAVRLPGFEEANELVFVNGIYAPELSTIRSAALQVAALEEAAEGEYKDIIAQHLGHSSQYLKDGLNALNTAFLHGGLFIGVKRGKAIEEPVYLYNIADARTAHILAQPRVFVHVAEAAQIELVESVITLGSSESFTNGVVEMVVEQDAWVGYYKIQADKSHAAQVSTTHIRQVGKCHVHTVTISLDGGTVRNNLNMVMEAPNSEAHLYGLYFGNGDTHIDNHTVVDNVAPNCYSNELYKGILDGESTGVFNGKIFVRQPAQKTNAYQSNKNILLSDSASVNTKPQLEIFADDVKCSHGCTIGRLDEEALFYLRSRGISQQAAKSLLLHAFAIDVLEHIKPEPIRAFVDDLISQRLAIEIV
jgi:Fe-S cluster assembly protein SufD